MSYILGALLFTIALALLGGALFGRQNDRRRYLAAASILIGLVAIGLLTGCSSRHTAVPTATSLPPADTAVPPTNTAMPGNQTSPLTSPVKTPSSTPTPANVQLHATGRIAFHSERTGDFEIWVMNADGTDAHPLTTAAGRDIEPAWSPDGTRIVFASARDDERNLQLYIMDADGSNQRRLFSDVLSWDNWSPDWSPDGQTIAFQSNRDVIQNGFDLYTVNIDGTNERPLFVGKGNQYHPDWSPDGKAIAFVNDAEGNADIWIANADGSNAHAITHTYWDEAYPRWSPDGQWILFQSNRDTFWRLYIMRPDGSDVRMISPALLGNDVMGAWSPDGKFIAFSSNRANNDWEIYIMALDGHGVQRLTFNFPEIMDRYPAWGK